MTRRQLLCTGQRPNTELLRNLAPNAIVDDGPNKGQVRVNRALQLAVPSTKPCCPDGLHAEHSHMFVIGDAADAFGATKLGYNAARQVCL